MNLERWYLAAKFSSEDAAGKVYYPFQEWLRPSVLDASVYRIMVKGLWHVVLLGKGNFPEGMKQQAMRYLEKGTITELPLNILETIASRREQRIVDARPVKGSTSVWTETHKPVPFHHVPEALGTDFTFTNLASQPSTDLNIKASISEKFLASLQKKPFIIAYQQYSEELYKQEWKQLIEVSGLAQHEQAINTFEYIHRINSMQLKRAKKYLFTASAMALHESVFNTHTDTSIPVTRGLHTWLEIHQETVTPYGNVRAVFFKDAFPLEEIQAIARGNSEALEILIDTHSPYNGKYTLEVITDTYEVKFDLTYNIGTKQWEYLGSHKCPYGTCKYPAPTTLEDRIQHEIFNTITPCPNCLAASGYFQKWLIVALAMIDGMYSLSPDDTQFKKEQKEYTTLENVTVGKTKKNQHVIKQEQKRAVEYTIVTYDVTQPRALTSEEETEIKEASTRKNWLVTTPSGNIIWVRKTIKAYSRKYPTRKDGTRQEGSVTIKNDFKKRVPMLRVPTKATIHKVVASNFRSE